MDCQAPLAMTIKKWILGLIKILKKLAKDSRICDEKQDKGYINARG